MNEITQYLVLGLGSGAMYALTAQGLVVIYRGSGTLNFAQGAIGMVGAFSVYELDQRGVPLWGSVPAGVAVSAALGLLIQVWIMRSMRNSSPLSRLIAILGFFVLIQSLAFEVWSTRARFLPRILPSEPMEIGGITLSQDRALLLLLAIGLTVLLTIASNYTRVGRATRAVADDQLSAAALRWSPNLIGAITWTTGGALAGVAAIFIASSTTLAVGPLTLMVLPALGAALIGRFSSFSVTFLAGLGIGMLQTLITHFVKAEGWAEAVPFLVIIGILVVQGRGLPLRHELLERLPSVGRGRLRPRSVLIATLVMVGVLFVLPPVWLDAATTVIVLSIVLLSVVVVTGLGGQLSLAQLALAGLAAWGTATAVSEWDWPFAAAAVFGIGGAIAIGAVAAVPALRVRGAVLAIATLGLAYVADSLILQNSERTGGLEGLNVGQTSLLGLDIDAIGHPTTYALVCLLALVGAALAVANVRRGVSGRQLLAVRGNERAAAAIGINVPSTKVYAFCLGAGLAGLGGILMGFRTRTVDLTQFATFGSITAVIYGALGGIGYVTGAIVGANFAPGALPGAAADEIGSSVSHWLTVLAGLGVIIVIKQRPDGLTHFFVTTLHKRARRRIERRATSSRSEATAKTVVDARPRMEPPERVEPRVLTVSNLAVRFGTTTVLSDVSLQVAPGEIVGLIGPNGAGKTTLIDAVTGFVRYQGTISIGGRTIDGLSPARRARHGVGRTFQSLELFEDMTVGDNIRTASEGGLRGLTYLTDVVRPKTLPLAGAGRAAVDVFALQDDLERMPTELSFARRRLVALARAVAASPSVLLLDEPAAGFLDHESTQLGSLVRQLTHRWGMAVLLVEHDMDLVFDSCDRVVALDLGVDIAVGTPDEIRQNSNVRAAYLGTSTVNA
ncbi:MAG: ABC transporter permease subunit [Actinomycetota bacterium]